MAHPVFRGFKDKTFKRIYLRHTFCFLAHLVSKCYRRLCRFSETSDAAPKRLKKILSLQQKALFLLFFLHVGNHCHIKIGRIVVCINNISANTRSTYFARENSSKLCFSLFTLQTSVALSYGKRCKSNLLIHSKKVFNHNYPTNSNSNTF